jgi:hypothetical protein
MIDTIYPHAARIHCSAVRKETGQPSVARVGSTVPDLRSSYRHPVSLWQEVGNHDLVALFFFEGNSRTNMTSPSLGACVRIIRERLGSVRLIGVNRRTTGAPYTDVPVIEENLDWDGPLVTRLRNHRDRELIVVDSLATVVCRAEPGRQVLEALWGRLKRNDLHEALARYDLLIGSAQLLAKAKYD